MLAPDSARVAFLLSAAEPTRPAGPLAPLGGASAGPPYAHATADGAGPREVPLDGPVTLCWGPSGDWVLYHDPALSAVALAR